MIDCFVNFFFPVTVTSAVTILKVIHGLNTLVRTATSCLVSRIHGSHTINTAKDSFENVAVFISLGTTLIEENRVRHVINKVCLMSKNIQINPLKAELNPICHLLALLGAHHILHVSRIRAILQGHMFCPPFLWGCAT
jgi:hypothetical protein